MKSLLANGIVICGLWPLNSLALESVISFPEDSCHAISSEERIYSAEPKSPFLKWPAIRAKADIVCVDRSIVVDKPLRSNGGDVFIYAESITLKARIDTRVFIDAKSYMHLPAQPTSGPGEALRSAVARPLFDDYYQRSPQSIKIGSKHYLPEGVSGTTEQWFPYCDADYLAGSPPSDSSIKFDTLRSGNIYLYANEIRFEANPEDVEIDDSDPLDCSKIKVKRQGVYLLTDGIRGGRGGAAKLTAPFGGRGCIPASYSRAGALNAPGGKGGDAGNVSVALVARNLSDGDHNIISSYASANAGPPGSSKKLRTPAYKGPDAAKTYDACGFIDEGNWPMAPSGQGGEIRVVNMGATKALLSFMKFIGLKDAAYSYDLTELSERAYIDPRISSADFTTFVEKSFYSQLRKTEQIFLESLNARILNKPAANVKPMPANFEGLDLQVVEENLFRNRVTQIVLDIVRFQANGPDEVLSSYFMKTGGALNIKNTQIQDTWSTLMATTETSRAIPTLIQIRAGLQDSNALLNSINTVLWSAEYKSELSRLNSRLNEVDAQLRDIASNSGHLSSLFKAVRGVSEGIAEVYAGYQTGKISTAAEGLQRISVVGQRLVDEIESNRSLFNERIALKAKIEALDQALVDFLRTSSIAREKFTKIYAKALLDYMDAAARLETMFDVRGHLFGDLLSASLLTYFSDPSRDERNLTFNLRSLYGALSGTISREGAFRFRTPLYAGCAPVEGVMACMPIGPGEARVIKMRSSMWYNGLPAFMLAPTLNGYYIPTFGEELIVEPQLVVESD